MTQIIAWLVNAFRFAAPASIGYFFNDLMGFIAKIFKLDAAQVTDPKTGRPKIWLVIVTFLLGGLLVFLVLKMLSGRKGKKAMFLLAVGAGCLCLDAYIFPDSGFVLATILATLTTGAGVVTTANTTFIPKYFFYAAATQLTGVKITVQGDGVVFDSDANGLTHCGVNRILGQVTNNFFFRIANGLITNKNVIWEFTNSAAQTPIVYISSDETPAAKGRRLYLQLLRQPAIGPGGTDFTDFATLSAPSMSATDYANILYNDGTQQSNQLRPDLQAYMGLTQNVVNTPIYQVDNWARRVKKVNLQVGVTQTVYIQRWVPPVSDGMIEGAIIAKG